MDTQRKIRLLEALEEAKSSWEMYHGLAQSAAKQMREIQAELNDSFQPGNSRYTNGELAAVRRGILEAMQEGKWITPRQLFDKLPNLSSDLITRELHKLAKNHRANVTWNKRHGSASAYCRW